MSESIRNSKVSGSKLGPAGPLFGVNSGPHFGANFGPIWGSFWGPFGAHVGTNSGPILGLILGPSWGPALKASELGTQIRSLKCFGSEAVKASDPKPSRLQFRSLQGFRSEALMLQI